MFSDTRESQTAVRAATAVNSAEKKNSFHLI